MSPSRLTANFWGSNVTKPAQSFCIEFKMQTAFAVPVSKTYIIMMWANPKIKLCLCLNPNGLQAGEEKKHHCRETHSYYTQLLLKCQMMIYSPHKPPTHENTKDRSKYQTSEQSVTWAALTLFSKSISSFSFPMRSSLSWWAFSNLPFSWRSLASSCNHTHTFTNMSNTVSL